MWNLIDEGIHTLTFGMTHANDTHWKFVEHVNIKEINVKNNLFQETNRIEMIN